MKYMKGILGLLILFLILGMSISACGSDDSASWKEEVLLHDGSKIIVERSQTRGGRREIGQPPPVKEHVISFTMPGGNQTITWTSEFGENIGRTNFNLLALHILNDTPYIVTTPNLCLSYNKWGRPNPPYVFFKYDSKKWLRIPLEKFPSEFKTLNVAISTLAFQDKLTGLGFVSTEKIKELNRSLGQPELKTILREPVKPGTSLMSCSEMVHTGNGRWIGIGWFEKSTYEECIEYCERKKISPQYCPCDEIFNKDKSEEK